MEVSWEHRTAATVLIPFATAAAIFLVRRRPELWTFVGAILTFLGTASLLGPGDSPVRTRLVGIVPGLDLAFRPDALGLAFGLLAAGLWIVTSVYSRGYVHALNLRHPIRYYGCFAAAIGSALGTAFAANLITFLVFYELLTLATYPLVAHKETAEALAAGRRYLAYTLSGGLALTMAAAWAWIRTGTLEFVPGGFLAGGFSEGGLAAVSALLLAGCGVKAAIMPAHAWLPSAMVAPTPVSALLHAVAVVKAGAFGCLRMIGYVIGPEALARSGVASILGILCGGTIVAGSLIALAQDNLKRRLAYSTVVHLSYIVLGAALLSPGGMAGSVLHLTNHGLAKITLFFCSGAIHAGAHRDKVSELEGLGRKMPWTFAAFAVASLGLIGIPGFCGFVSKLFIARGALEGGEWGYLVVVIGGALLSAFYLVPILASGYLGTSKDEVREAPMSLVIPCVVTAGLVVVLGVVWPVIDAQAGMAGRVARELFGGKQ